MAIKEKIIRLNVTRKIYSIMAVLILVSICFYQPLASLILTGTPKYSDSSVYWAFINATIF
ncbi:MAG: hypothetical protein AMQ74_00347 [Candidatus Methanofastidiosum methylothiophilum]|uniref:Uncharacterized protein n=1 Tax=Candidatus Methanofastidiosum methylothiophilum TaxID=1705564 RepID=A0A150J9H0_9EURY|nr:MAG: hypothetical protein AMQ74_00347 [Candidatus Methanofastidiosum methylthiophilus]